MKHYALPPLKRLPEFEDLVNSFDYFTLVAPRNSGKTTTILAAVDQINEYGEHYALRCSLKRLQKIMDKDEAMSRIVGELEAALALSKVGALRKVVTHNSWGDLKAKPDFNDYPVRLILNNICRFIYKDLVVFFDDFDCLEERLLLYFFPQLRDGLTKRDRVSFPRFFGFITVRDMGDFTANVRKKSNSWDKFALFICSEYLILANFTLEEVRALYSQHTEATGQVFLEEAVQRAYYWSGGQPRLVNALAREVLQKILRKDYGPPITAALIDEATHNLRKRGDIHFDSLLDCLSEPGVKRIIEPILEIRSEDLGWSDRDIRYGRSFDEDCYYCQELGLIKEDHLSYQPANPFYASLISRYLNSGLRKWLPNGLVGQWMNGESIDMNGLVKAFQRFWAQNSEDYLKGVKYQKAFPHLFLTAFFQKVVNWEAEIIEECDLELDYSYLVVQYAQKSYVLRLEIKSDKTSLANSLEQIKERMNGLLVKEGWLLEFDRDWKNYWPEKITWETITQKISENQSEDLTIHVVGL
ncbi:MAG: hypothetical protein LBS60_09305 [Deltaproteobacteria bacterium]|nr:hypothetical protein [Deltaproteobacteria bacterium]